MELKYNFKGNIGQYDELKPLDLRCEYLINPLGIDTLLPRFSWKVESSRRGQYQTAYQVLVSSNEAALELDTGDLWDSGKVTGSETLNVIYEGKTLNSRQKCFWKVKIWDMQGNQGPFSNIASFEMGLLNKEDWKARWIGSSVFGAVSPMFRKEFYLERKVSKARAYISGLGYYELSINGKKVNDRVLDPAWTDYSKRVLYSTYEIEDYLNEGANAVGVILGDGWFSSYQYHSVVPAMQMLLQIELEHIDGTRTTITSDSESGWKINSKGPIISNSIYNGEIYDARLEMSGWDTPFFDTSVSAREGREWKHTVSVEAPGGKLISQTMEPIKVVMDRKPVKVIIPKPGVLVYDFGQNFSGWVQLAAKGHEGTKITMRYSELLYEDGSVNTENLRTAKATDIYIMKGGGTEVYEPRFTYHGFRYVQLEGYPDDSGSVDVTGRVVRSAVESAGSFICSNDLINKIQDSAAWTEASNLMGLLTDCPQRDERLGWLNDATVRAEEAVYNFKMVSLLNKWERDISDTQGKDTGAIADTAPFHRLGRRPADPVCMSYLIIPWMVYLHYGDRRILEEHYEGMKKWVEYLRENSDKHIVVYSSYGDWASPVTQSVRGSVGAGAISANTPGELMSTGYYYYGSVLLSKIAGILGKDKDVEYFSQLACQISDGFNVKFLNREKGWYATNSQACNVFPLYLGIVPEQYKQSVIDQIVKDVMETNQGHLTTGNLCSRYILDVLTEAGRIDVAYTLAAQTTYPSWGYMILNGATTIWERWEHVTKGEQVNMASHNHPMYASISAWFYKVLAGINISEEKPGFGKIVIKPFMPENLEYAKALVSTVRGMVKSGWKKASGNITMDISIPFNCSGLIYVPKTGTQCIITENANVIWKAGQFVESSEGVVSAVEREDYVVFEVISGVYRFELSKNNQ